MMLSRPILGLIPARRGSKGVADKNLRNVGGRPLISYSLDVAISCRALNPIIVSTDDERIIELARQMGLEVPFTRPSYLSGDDTPMLPVVQHALDEVERISHQSPEWICLLQPTAPLRTKEDVEAAIEIARHTDADSVVSVVQVFATHPILMKRIRNERLLPYCIEEKEGTRRQDLEPPAFMRNGAIYLLRPEVIRAGSLLGRSTEPYVMPEERSINIDSELDLELVEALLRRRVGA